MSDSPACRNCRHWNAVSPRSARVECVGECRRRAPAGGLSQWPRTRDGEFCAEFDPRAVAVAFATRAPEPPAPRPTVAEVAKHAAQLIEGARRDTDAVEAVEQPADREQQLSLGASAPAPEAPATGAKTRAGRRG